MVANGEILTYEQALATGLPIREVEIVDALLPGIEDDVLAVNMIQRMTDSGRRVRFNVLCVVGNSDGYVGLAICKGKEVAPTIKKAIDKAKLNLIPVMRGNGSWESGGGPGTSVPLKITGRSGSTRVTLMPAPAGKGLVSETTVAEYCNWLVSQMYGVAQLVKHELQSTTLRLHSMPLSNLTKPELGMGTKDA
jgi:small subunit ribosomal protein S5